MSRRTGSYASAIEWIALNDDTQFLNEPSGCESVSLALVADVFGRDIDEALADLRRALKRIERAESQS